MRVRYVLDDGDDDPPGFLVQHFVVPKRIQTVQSARDAVVKSQKHVLEESDSQVLVYALVTCGGTSTIPNNNHTVYRVRGDVGNHRSFEYVVFVYDLKIAY